jgi:hypothetical protein
LKAQVIIRKWSSRRRSPRGSLSSSYERNG